ncbi:MAG: hypothetical protein AAGD32_08025 [Planctomycetota bacterium]
MFEQFRERLKSTPGMMALAGLLGVSLVVMAWNAWGMIASGSEIGDMSRHRLMICAETGETFHHELQLGDRFPVSSPHSGRNTGYEAELCYWTADGGIADEPSYVFVKQKAGIDEPTFCGDCDRLVRNLNLRAVAGQSPPPTRTEFESNRAP